MENLIMTRLWYYLGFLLDIDFFFTNQSCGNKNLLKAVLSVGIHV